MSLLEPDEALAQVLAAVPSPIAVRLPPERCRGLVLAEDALAPADLPPFDRAMMDGYAVRLADAGRTVAILDEIPAGDGAARQPLQPSQAHPIMTGAPVPAGAEAVVPVEQTTHTDGRVSLPERIRPRANIVARGTECAAGRPWARAGEMVTPMVLAAAIGVGARELAVLPRPQVVVVTTGSELADDPARPGQIRDSNGPMLVALFDEAGLAATRRTVADDETALLASLRSLEAADAVVLTGGVSAGTHDEVPGVLARFGAEMLFHKVAQRPGKPLLLARRGRQLLFGLPGNPLAAHLCACRYAIPALRRLAGLGHVPLGGRGVLAADLPENRDRTWFLPARVRDGVVQPLPPVSSADLVQPHQADAYLRLEPGAAAVPAGAEVAYIRIGAAAWPS